MIRHVEEDERRKKIISEHEEIFKNNHTIKDQTIDIQLKKDIKPIQQKGRQVPIHFQKNGREELEKLIESGHIEKADETTENFHFPCSHHHQKGQICQNCVGFKKA